MSLYKRITAAVLCVFCLVSVLAGCSQKLPPVPYSTENIVCEYTRSGGYGLRYELIPVTITVYNDNTVRLWSGPFDDRFINKYYGGAIEVVHEEYFTISEEQKQEIIALLEKNEINRLGDLSDDTVLDGSSSYIRLFDENGEVVHSCGGYAVSNKAYGETAGAVSALIGQEAYAQFRRTSAGIAEEKYNEALESLLSS